MGLPKNVAISHTATLCHMQHCIRTGFRILKDTIPWDEKKNFGGLGQGNGGASVSWYSHMLPLEKVYEAETGEGVEYHNPDKNKAVFPMASGSCRQ